MKTKNIAAFCFYLFVSSGTALGQFASNSPREDFWMPDERIQTMDVASDTLYLGGQFTRFDPIARSFGIVSLPDGMAQTRTPNFEGDVRTIIADGNGGWFVGGRFPLVDDQIRGNLAHIGADGALLPWAPRALAGESTILDMVLVGDALVCAGNFNTGIMMIDSQTGESLGWPFQMGGSARDLQVVGDTLYIGGNFTSVDGQARSGMAAIDLLTWTLLPWAPVVSEGPATMIVTGSAVFAGGRFSLPEGDYIYQVVGFDAVSGEQTDFQVPCDVARTGGPMSLETDDVTLWIGGEFDGIDGHSRANLAAVDIATGEVLPFDPSVRVDPGSTERPQVLTMILDGTDLYFGGRFHLVNDLNHDRVASVNASTGELTIWDPRMRAATFIEAIIVEPDRVILGGRFPALGGVARSGLAAINLETGAATAWNPDLLDLNETSIRIEQLAASQVAVHVAGMVSADGQLDEPRLATVDPGNGDTIHVYDFAGVFSLAAQPRILPYIATQDIVYVAGRIPVGPGQTLDAVAAIDPLADSVLWVSEQIQFVNDVALNFDGSMLVIATDSGVRTLDPATGAAGSWSTDTNAPVFATDFSDDHVLIGGDFDVILGRFRPYASQLTLSLGRPTAWAPAPDASVYSVSRYGNVAAMSGNFRNIGSEAHRYLGAVDLASGSPCGWRPLLGQPVTIVRATGQTVVAAGEFTQMAGHYWPYLAAFDIEFCIADFNQNCVVDTLDFLAYLNAFSAQDPLADINEDGRIDTLDFLAFLRVFDGGCP